MFITSLITSLIGLYRQLKAKYMKQNTTWDDLPMDVKRIIYKVQRNTSPFPAASSDGWPELKFGANTTWRQAIPPDVLVQIEDCIKNKSVLKLCDKWHLDEALTKLGTSSEGFAVWLVHDMPMWRNTSLDDKVLKSFHEKYRYAATVAPIDEENWFKQAEKLMEHKTRITLYDVYKALWNNYGTTSTLFRDDIEGRGW